jgi:hypothetical protein
MLNSFCVLKKGTGWQPKNCVIVQARFRWWNLKKGVSVLEKCPWWQPKNGVNLHGTYRGWHTKIACVLEKCPGWQQISRQCEGEVSRVAP